MHYIEKGFYHIQVAMAPDGKLTSHFRGATGAGPLATEFAARTKPGGYTFEGSVVLSAEHFPDVEIKEGMLCKLNVEIDDADATEARELKMVLFQVPWGTSWNHVTSHHYGQFELK
jgi:hypothetical protein